MVDIGNTVDGGGNGAYQLPGMTVTADSDYSGTNTAEGWNSMNANSHSNETVAGDIYTPAEPVQPVEPTEEDLMTIENQVDEKYGSGFWGWVSAIAKTISSVASSLMNPKEAIDSVTSIIDFLNTGKAPEGGAIEALSKAYNLGDKKDDAAIQAISDQFGLSHEDAANAWNTYTDSSDSGSWGGWSDGPGGGENTVENDGMDQNANAEGDTAGGSGGNTAGGSGSTSSGGYSSDTIAGQLDSLFSGSNPQYSIPGMIEDYTTGSQSAYEDYAKNADGLTLDWNEFERKYNDIGASILDDYDQIRTTYEQNMGSIPGLNMILPDYMGGGSVALAPNAWGRFYSDQASTSSGIVDNQSNFVPKMAEIESTGITNRTNLNQNNYANNLGNLANQRYPLNLAVDLGKMEQQFKNNMAITIANQPEEPSIWESIIPAIGYAASNWGE